MSLLAAIPAAPAVLSACAKKVKQFFKSCGLIDNPLQK
jgi:hypothetical protein